MKMYKFLPVTALLAAVSLGGSLEIKAATLGPVPSWQGQVFSGGGQGAHLNYQPGDLDGASKQRWSLGDTAQGWFGGIMTFIGGWGYGYELSWQDGQATGWVGLNVTLFEVDPVLMRFPDMSPLASPNRPLRLGTMWSGLLVWNLQFSDPFHSSPYREYFDAGSVVITHAPDPVSFDYQGFSYVLNPSISERGPVGAIGLQLAEGTAVPEPGSAAVPLLFGLLALWLLNSDRQSFLPQYR